jgi:homoserine kinase
VPHGDAAFNLGRLGLLIAGLADHRQLVPEAFADRLHQDARGVLFPEAATMLEGLRHAGALGACWSGAGPTLLALTTVAGAPALAETAGALLGDHGVPGVVRVAGVDLDGVRVWAEAPY